MAYKFQKGLFEADGAISGSSTVRMDSSISSSGDLAVTGAMHVGTFIYGNGSKLTNISSDNVDVTDSSANSEFRLVGVAASGDGVALTCMDTAAQRVTMNASTGLLTITGDASVGDDLSLASDAAVLNFGADSDVNLTHVADTGLLLNSSRQLQFGDSATNIQQSSDGHLEAAADTAVVLDTPTVHLEDDAVVLEFGADSDVSLTHVADTGLLLNSTMALQFNDSSQYIKASSAADLDIAATTDINLDCTTVDINAALNSSGASTLASTSGVTTIGSSNQVTISAAGVLDIANTTAASAIGTAALVCDGGASVAADLYVGDDLMLLSDAAVLNFGADSDVNLTHVADTGLLLNSSMQLQFRDSTEYINSDADGYINIRGATGVDLNINGTDRVNVTSAGLNVVGTLTGDTSLTLDSTTITTAEIGVLDGVTAGAGAASKALVLDASADIASGLRSVTGSGDVLFANGHFTGGIFTAGSDTIGSDGQDEVTINSVAAFKNGWELNITASGGAMDLTDAGALIVLCTGSAAQTVTLQGSQVPNDGYAIVVKNASSADREITITGSATGNVYDAYTIDGQKSLVLESPYAAVNLIWSATNGGWSVY